MKATTCKKVFSLRRRLPGAAGTLVTALLLVTAPLAAQDFGFGGYDDPAGEDDTSGFGFGSDTSGGSGGFSTGLGAVEIGGEVKAETQLFFSDLESGETFKALSLGDIFSGKLNFSVEGSAADVVVNLNLNQGFNSGFFGTSPFDVDEAYVRAYFGPVSLEAGLRKLTWGKADNQGPLDVVNPKDYSDMSAVTDSEALKIAQPMIHGVWSLGFSKVEAVFVPMFQANRFATNGRWAPAQLRDLIEGFGFDLDDYTLVNNPRNLTETSGLEYAQAGIRFTTTVGPVDLGAQYYYGRSPQGMLTGVNPGELMGDMPLTPGSSIDLSKISMTYAYNPYHQIGLDYAQVIGGFNLRAEFAANLTGDFDGDDPAVYNPALVWSLGFDRELWWGLTLNLQCNTSLILAHDNINDDDINPMAIMAGGAFPDGEANTDLTSSRVTCVLSKTFLRDELEVKAVALWGIEDKDFLLMPQVSWTRNDLTATLVAGIFGGDEDGSLGQYSDNGFVTLSLAYNF